MEKKINIQNTENIDMDFEKTAVPKNARKSFWSITIVWLGFVFVITSMMTGGGLASGLSFKQIIFATTIGNVFLCLIAIAIANMASKTGLSFALITRHTFGNKGSKIATLFVPIVNIGWYTIQAATYGKFISSVLGIEGYGELAILFLSAIVMGIFSFAGIKAITILGYIAIPAIIFLSMGTALKSGNLAGWDTIFNWIPAKEMSMVNGVTIVIGTWILSTATCIADTMRFAKNPKEAMLSACVGLLGGNSLLILCGSIAGIGMNDSDLTAVLLKLGLVIPSLILMTTNIFTTNAANLYSSSLNLANSFSTDRKKIIAIVLLASGLLCLTKPYDIAILFTFLNLLGVIVPPLAGIILSNYYIVNERNYPDLNSNSIKDWAITPWISWVASLVIVKLLSNVAEGCSAINGIFGLPALNGIIAGFIIYNLIAKFTKKGA
ncbi:cytosine permease [Anaerococcus porci]|uniref:Allantoin permease n=1 Tax=Anaerococcus porci TaxID=2652269 RepID=A0A6N7VG80_9FIRM|nr:cytosine permease [Anaerococcus porci]MDY3006051.1 cytosine permease [Anaerococcus porci]MSS78450.1 allantoin permease [Anaerococcus porci]